MDATLRLLEQLIARASVTPDDAGCQALIAERLEALGFVCEHLPFGPDEGRVDNLWAVRTGAGPAPRRPGARYLGSARHGVDRYRPLRTSIWTDPRQLDGNGWRDRVG